MNTEQKAAAYDEALERATQKWECGLMTREDLEELFPELAESEDEKIRKELVKYFTEGREFLSLCSVGKEEILAWLEKQGEQKLGWSNEDEIGLIDALDCVEKARKVAKDENCMGNAWYAERWLKSLKGRCLPEPKQEWSEEDEEIIKLIESSTWDGEKLTQGEAGIVHKWLKSLRPQKHEDLPKWRRLPLSDVSYTPDSWRVMGVITSTVNGNSTSVQALVKGDYYVPLFELDKIIRKE